MARRFHGQVAAAAPSRSLAPQVRRSIVTYGSVGREEAMPRWRDQQRADAVAGLATVAIAATDLARRGHGQAQVLVRGSLDDAGMGNRPGGTRSVIARRGRAVVRRSELRLRNSYCSTHRLQDIPPRLAGNSSSGCSAARWHCRDCATWRLSILHTRNEL